MRRLLCLLLIAVAAAAGEVLPPSDLAPDPAVRMGVLANGVRWAWQRHDQPVGKISLRLHVIAGSLDEHEHERGLAHFLEHMAFNGTPSFPPGTMVPRLQALGIAFGAHSNAHTSFDETVYKLELPEATPAMLDLGLTLMAETAGGMLLAEEEVVRERGVILAELRDRDGPGRRTSQAVYAAALAGTRLPQRFPIGIAETIAAADAAILRSYYRRMYRPERLVVTVVGAIGAEVEPAIAARFAGLRGGAPQPEREVVGRLAPGAGVLIHPEPEAAGLDLALIRMTQPGLRRDGAAWRREQLLRQVAMRILGRRYAARIEADPEGPLLSARGMIDDWLGLDHVWLSAQIRPGQALRAVAALEQPMRSLREHGPTAAEVALERTAILAELDREVAQAGTRQARAIAERLANDLANGVVPLSPMQWRELASPWLVAMDAAGIREAVRAAWAGPAARDTAVISGRGADAVAAADLVRTWAAATAAALAPPAERTLAVWAYPPATGAVVASTVPMPGIWRGELANGVVALARPATAQPGQVLIEARLLHGSEDRPAGAAELLSRAFIAGGLGRHDQQDLRELLAATGIRGLRIESAEDGTVIALDCLPGDLAFACRLLGAWIGDPGWRADSVAPARTAWLAALDAEPANLGALMGRRHAELIGGGAADRRPATRAEAEALTWEQVRAWYAPRLAQAPLSVAIAGEVELPAVAAAVAQGFSHLPPRAAQPLRSRTDRAWMRPSPPWPAGTAAVSASAAKPHAIVRVYWPADDATAVERNRIQHILAGCLSDLMRQRVREELGIAYSPFATRWASDGFAGSGWLMAEVQCAPDKAEQALAEIRALAARLAASGVDAAQLDQVRQPQLRNLAAFLARNQWWMAAMLTRGASQPWRFEPVERITAALTAIGPADVSAMAREILIDDRALVMIGIAGSDRR